MNVEVFDAGATVHGLAGGPPVQICRIAIEVLRVEGLVGHCAVVHKPTYELRPHPLGVIEACAIGTGGTEDPVAVVERVADGVTGRTAALIELLIAECDVVGGDGDFVAHFVGAEAAGVHGAATVHGAIGGFVAIGAGVAADELMQDEIEIDGETVTMGDGDKTAEGLGCTVTSGDAALLIEGAEIAGAEDAVAIAT